MAYLMEQNIFSETGMNLSLPRCPLSLAEYISNSNLPYVNVQLIWVWEKHLYSFLQARVLSTKSRTIHFALMMGPSALVCFDDNIRALLLKMNRGF